MKISQFLSESINESFESFLQDFAEKHQLNSDDSILSERHINRCALPHIRSLSDSFNRLSDDDLTKSYWAKGSHPTHFRSSYLMSFHIFNTIRMASIFEELERQGFTIEKPEVRMLEIGSAFGPALSAMALSRLFENKTIQANLLDSDPKILKLAQTFNPQFHQWSPYGGSLKAVRTIRKRLESPPLLSRDQGRYDFIFLSYFLNELNWTTEQQSKSLVRLIEDHLKPNGLLIVVEPALKVTSRRLLEIRKELLRVKEKKNSQYQILLPCLGEQSCGAFENKKDWCHEEVSWWRPKYIKYIDQKLKLDHKRLPFSYLVLTNSDQPKEKIFPKIKKWPVYRQVSPCFKEGQYTNFHLCGDFGKNKVKTKKNPKTNRGDLFEAPKIEQKGNSIKISHDF